MATINESKQDRQAINRYRLPLLSADVKYLIRRYALSPIIFFVSLIAFAFYRWLPHQLYRPIFVIGCSRSGTTIFLDVFRQHSELADWSEAGQILELRYYDRECDHLRDETDATAFERRRLQSLFGVFVSITGKPRLLNKHPQNSYRIRFLKAIFPDAIFIHLVRDGRAVALSNLAQVKRDRFRQRIPFGSFPKPRNWRNWLDRTGEEQYAYQWVDVVEYIRETAKSELCDRNYIEVRYEEFCSDPAGVLTALDDFCGLARGGRDPQRIPHDLRIDNDKWMTVWNEDQKSRVHSIQAALLKELGYPLPSPPAQSTKASPQAERASS